MHDLIICCFAQIPNSIRFLGKYCHVRSIYSENPKHIYLCVGKGLWESGPPLDRPIMRGIPCARSQSLPVLLKILLDVNIFIWKSWARFDFCTQNWHLPNVV